MTQARLEDEWKHTAHAGSKDAGVRAELGRTPGKQQAEMPSRKFRHVETVLGST